MMASHPLLTLFIFVACIVCGWLAILGVIYAGLWSAFLHRLGTAQLFLINAGASIVLSPGVIGGHGVLPFPAGLAALFGGKGSARMLNLALWMCTLAFFLVLSRWLRKRSPAS